MKGKKYQRFINVICSEAIPEPRLRWMFLKAASPSKIGRGSTPWPGARIYDSVIGRYCGIGMATTIISSRIGDKSIICGKAVVKDVDVGRECFIAANARVTRDVPDRTFVTGTDKTRKRNFEPRPSNRDVERTRFERMPVWDWEFMVKHFGVYGMIELIPKQFFTNSVAAGCRNSSAKTRLASVYCNISKNAHIHYSAMLDSMFPRNIRIKEGADVKERSLILSHSMVDEAGYVLERGNTVIGKNSVVGEDSVVLPGIEVPDDTLVPPSSLVTASGAFLVKENRKVPWEELRR